MRGKHISKLSLASLTEICPRIRSLLASQELEQQHVHRVSSNKSCRSHPCSGISTLIAYAHLPSYLPSNSSYCNVPPFPQLFFWRWSLDLISACRIGSGTRYLQIIFTILMAVLRETRWPTEIYMGLHEPLVDLIAAPHTQPEDPVKVIKSSPLLSLAWRSCLTPDWVRPSIWCS